MKILGDYHTHTYYSDGQAAVIEMVRVAKENGLHEIAITDHSMGKWSRRFKRSNFEKLCGDVESARSEMPVLVGVESNLISTNGRIDVDNVMREKLDILLFGVHILVLYSPSAFLTFCLPNLFFRCIRFTPKFQVRYNTKVVKRVIEKNKVDIWTHPNKYFKLDVMDVAKACIERGTLIELNSRKISFRPIDFERMAAIGAKFVINSDAHSTKRVGDIARVEEFLKNCDYDPKVIINLNKTFTEYKHGNISGRNQSGNIDEQVHINEPEPEEKPKQGKFFRRKS